MLCGMGSAAETGSDERAGSDAVPLGIGGKTKRLGLVCALAVLTLNVWTGGPLLSLWIGSRVQGSGPPSMAAIAAVAGSLIAISLVLVKALAFVSDSFDRLVGRPRSPREPAPWLRSLRSESSSERAERVGLSVPERVLVISVVAAVAAFEVWFFFLSGSPIGQTSGR
jgi:hypothetical protein